MGTPKDESMARAAQALLSTGPQIGERYRHYKGDEYVITDRTAHSDSLQQMVSYRSVKYGYKWTHFLDDFLQLEVHEGKEVPRFQLMPRDGKANIPQLNEMARKGFNS